MSNEILRKLWVVKFCIKVVYPKYNFYLFLVFLAIKYRLYQYKKTQVNRKMETFELKCNSPSIHLQNLKGHLEDNIPLLGHKVLVIGRDQFIDLASQNLFYLDNGVLWIGMKLSPSLKKNLKDKKNNSSKNKFLKYNLNFVTAEVHKKLWANNINDALDKLRIVPIMGSKHVQDNTVVLLENEYSNIEAAFGLKELHIIEIGFHPVPSFKCAPKIAATAEVSLIVNDYDLSNEFIKEILSNHFQMPRLIHINDIFSIELTPEVTAKQHYKYLDLVQSVGKLYFKCQKLGSGNEDNSENEVANENVDKPYYIVKGVTQLSLSENIHSLKPKDEYFDLDGLAIGSPLLRSCPDGLKQKFDQMQATIAPFLSEDLSELITSLSSPIMPMLLLSGAVGSGRHLLVNTLAKYNGMTYLHVDCNALQSSTAKQTESKLSATVQKAKAAAPAIVLLDNFEVFAVDAENNEDCRLTEYFVNTLTELYQNYTKHAIIFVALTESAELKPNILRIFLEKFHIPKLNSQQRLETLQWFASAMDLKIRQPVDEQENSKDMSAKCPVSNEVLQRLAAKTETYLYGDMDTLMHFAARESYLKQLRSGGNTSSDPNMRLIEEADFNSALESMRSLQSQHLDAPKIPKVYWEDIGGLDKLKKELLKTIEFPIKYPHLFKNSSLKRSGVLLYGPPGCGKTLVAKAVSTELNVSFLSVKGPELLNMYIGQSEENVRRVFSLARASSPCIVFLDELDALAGRRGGAGDSGGAADRVVSQLLAELDAPPPGDDASGLVFVMGATNRPDLLEQSLLRPGRLDKLIYVGPYCGTEEKTKVLTALCRSHALRPEVSLERVSRALPERVTGADLTQVLNVARRAAVRALLQKLHNGTIKESSLSPESVVIGVSEFCEGVDVFRPSVTDEEMAYYESLHDQM